MTKTSTVVCRTLPFVFLLAFACGEAPLDETTITDVNGKQITIEDFKEDFLLRPKFDLRKKGREAFVEQLESMVANKLLAEEAERRGLANDNRIEKRLGWVKKRAMVDQLYREKVRDEVAVSKQELREGFVKKNVEIHARHLFVKTFNEAVRLRERLEAGETFEALAKEVFEGFALAENGGDLGTFTWGDMDPDFEAAAFALDVGEISEPVKTRWGYHIIKVENRTQQAILTEADFQSEKGSIERTIRTRKEDVLASRYAADVMKGKEARVKGPLFAYVVNTARDALKDAPPLLPSGLPIIGDEEIGELRSTLEDKKQQPFIETKDRVWTLGDFLDLLESMPLDERPHLDFPSRFLGELKDMIRDEYLAEEAEAEGLQDHPVVLADIGRWRETLLAARMKSEIAQGISVTAEEVRDYFDKHKGSYGKTAVDSLSADEYEKLKWDALNAKRAIAIQEFVADLKGGAHIRQNELAYERAFEEVGGDNASFIYVTKIRRE